MLLEQSLEMVDTPHKMKMGVTGCPRNCAEVLTKDFGVVCVENGYQLYIGGNGGTEVREADFVMIVPTEDDVLRIAALTCNIIVKLVFTESVPPTGQNV